MKQQSPLGKYATAVAAFIIVFVIVAAVLQHLFMALEMVHSTDTLIDAMALVAFGIVTGTGASLTMLNGTVKAVDEHAAELADLKAQVKAATAIAPVTGK